MSSAQNFKFEHNDATPRNALAVLNMDPTFQIGNERLLMSEIPHLLRQHRDELDKLAKELQNHRTFGPFPEPRHGAYLRRKKDWRKAEQKEDLQEGRFVLDCYVQDFSEMMLTRDDISGGWEDLYKEIETLAASTPAGVAGAPLPRRREDCASGTCVIDLPTVADVEEFLSRISPPAPANRDEKKTDTKKKVGKKKKGTEVEANPSPAPADAARDLLKMIVMAKKYLDILTDRIELEDTYLCFEEEVKLKYHDRAKDDHPDRNPGDGDAASRFKEANSAYDVLSDATDEIRDLLAFNLVFGDTAAWTPEMRATLKGVVASFAPIFAAEITPPLGDMCKDCKGKGAIMRQAPNDYIPVAMRCEPCKGNGTVPAVTGQIRNRAAAVVKDGKKKKK